MEVAYLGGGCFWCTEAYFNRLKGVSAVESGYAGGRTENPTYKEICTGTTGHAELIKVSYDAEVISFEDLLEVFFQTHDPTTLNRQGADVGTQYRSVIFYQSDEERQQAQAFIDQAANTYWNNPIVTTLEPLKQFYPAEAYHNDYYNLNPGQGYCRIVIAPKLKKLEQQFGDKLKTS